MSYTHEQWAKIDQAIQHLQASPAAIKVAHRRLESAAIDYVLSLFNGPERMERNKAAERDWKRIAKLSQETEQILRRRRQEENIDVPPPPSGEKKSPHDDHYQRILTSLVLLRVISNGKVASPHIDDDGFPKARPRAWFHFKVLEVWTSLGGQLRFSRHPTGGKIAGPLARYFLAVTQPVEGGSLESNAIGRGPQGYKLHIAEIAILGKLHPQERTTGAIPAQAVEHARPVPETAAGEAPLRLQSGETERDRGEAHVDRRYRRASAPRLMSDRADGLEHGPEASR